MIKNVILKNDYSKRETIIINEICRVKIRVKDVKFKKLINIFYIFVFSLLYKLFFRRFKFVSNSNFKSIIIKYCQNSRPKLDRFSPIASLDKKSIIKRSTKSSQRLDCLSYYLIFYNHNTILFLYEIASRDKQS